jgi:predicted 3-demethylubiquinone-9 3-methyltransferase (glyoxalase superfamily)
MLYRKLSNFDNISANNGQDIVKFYASYFSKAYCISTHTNFGNNNLNDKIINSTFSFNKLKFTEIDVFNLISSLPLISSSGVH